MRGSKIGCINQRFRVIVEEGAYFAALELHERRIQFLRTRLVF